MCCTEHLLSRVDSSWKENRVFTVPTNERTGPIKEKYREVGQEPYKERKQEYKYL